MEGVILAGGEGTRLHPTTKLYNKHIALVYDRPMIHYPVSAMAEMGIDGITIVASRTSVGEISRYVEDGSQWGVDVTYKVQPANTGIPQALAVTDMKGVFPFMLGDCYYDPAPPLQDKATLFWHEFPTATEHSVWNPEADAIIEKPRFIDIGQRAVIGYFYDERVFDFIDDQNPSEIVDLHNFYRGQGAQMVEYEGFFGDMGTPKGLIRVAQHIQEKQGES